MKLVDILARELKVWPESWGIYCVSSKVEGSFAAWFGYRNPVFVGGGWSDRGTVELWLSAEPEDRRSVVVRRFEWQAAVDALKTEVRPTESMALHHQEVGRITRQWNGEGLPPAGAVCEFQGDCAKCPSDPWHKELHGGVRCTVIAHFKSKSLDLVAFTFVKADGNSELEQSLPGALRPIRTPEQIAAEDRDKAVDQMQEVFWRANSGEVREGLAAIYDAGYRKFEIVDN